MEISIWKSRKFWIMVVDVVVSLVTYFVGRYVSPEAGKDIMTIVLSLQPIIISVVVSITVQNVAGINAQGKVEEAALYQGVGESEPE